MPLPPPLHLPWPRPLLLPLQLLGSRLGWCSIARLRDSVGTPFIVVRELWLALIPGRAYRPRSKSVGRVLRCCPGKLRYGYSQIGSIGRTVGPGAAADLGGIWTRSGWSSGIRSVVCFVSCLVILFLSTNLQKVCPSPPTSLLAFWRPAPPWVALPQAFCRCTESTSYVRIAARGAVSSTRVAAISLVEAAGDPAATPLRSRWRGWF